ncbi:Protein of uncharacterised function (DUF2920) [Campylobacter lari]|uniref:DUF2920 family protein n=1 Tax=Campylobacter lari TaxID=201 RepID=UPI000DF100F2|nr:DUF2920 family protein [Campylobacter lari]STA75253.1 Protein of uncharacterised function (DUF2920) [Campylobacter lari]
MLINQTYFIDSCDDVELNIKRESKLEYRITYDDSKQMKAVVFIIGGYGTNTSMAVMDFDRQYIAQKYDVVVVNVIYWCFSIRRSNDANYSAKLSISKEDLRYFERTLENLGLSVFGLNENTAGDFIQKLDSHVQYLKDVGRRQQDYKATIAATLIPPNNEYQNYGIMAAIDHINALKDIMIKFPQFQNLPKIYGGGSYGGYLSLLISKIAPWHVDAVLDNSGEALLLLQYIIGKELNQTEFIIYEKNVQFCCFLKTYWNADSNSPYCFKKENYMIRALLNPTHLALQAQKDNNIKYISYHSSADSMTPVKDKIQLMQIYKNLGYDVDFKLIEDNVDGGFIKHSEHGGGITIKGLFKKEVPRLLETFKGKKFDLKQDSISYPCENKVFYFKDHGSKFDLEII